MPEDLEAMLGQAIPEQDLRAVMEQGVPEQGLEEEGRGTDTVVGHLTPGEIVIPVEVLSNPDLSKAIEMAFQESGIDVSQYTVGSEANNINPETGYPEFLFGRSRRRRARRARRAARQEYLRQRAENKAKFEADMAEFSRIGKEEKVKSQKALGKIRSEKLLFQQKLKSKYFQKAKEEQSIMGVATPESSSPTSKKFSKKKFKQITRIARQGQKSKRPK